MKYLLMYIVYSYDKLIAIREKSSRMNLCENDAMNDMV